MRSILHTRPCELAVTMETLRLLVPSAKFYNYYQNIIIVRAVIEIIEHESTPFDQSEL